MHDQLFLEAIAFKHILYTMAPIPIIMVMIYVLSWPRSWFIGLHRSLTRVFSWILSRMKFLSVFLHKIIVSLATFSLIMGSLGKRVQNTLLRHIIN